MVRIETDRSRVLAGIEKNADVVGSTMGPWGMNVTVDFGTGMATFKDGVSVSKLMAFDDVWENLGSALVSAACRRTVEEAGDGTTATAVLTAALCRVPEYGFSVEHRIRRAVDVCLERIRLMSVPVVVDGKVDGEMLRSVATISANGREDLGEMIGGMAERLGVYGQISVEEGLTLEAEVLNGYSYPGKVLAHQFNNKPGRLEVEECMVMLLNEEVDALSKIAPVLKAYNSLEGKKLPLVIVVGGMSGQALSTLAGNIDRFRGGQSGNEIYVVSAPSFGEERHLMMEDLSAIAGCPVFNHMRGNEVSRFGRKDFGRVERVKVAGSRVFFFGDVPDSHIDTLKQMAGSEKRLAMLTGGIGVIRVGGATEMEVANDRELVEDAVRAVYSAMDGGVVPGCGRCLEVIAYEMTRNEDTKLIAKALLAPAERIWANRGLKYVGSGESEPWKVHPPEGEAIDLKVNGIIDPAKVVSSSLKNAASAAIQFLTTNNFLSYR